MNMDSKQTARSAMTTNPELVQSFIDSAKSAGASDELIDSLLDMDIEELRAKSQQLKDVKAQAATRPDTQE
jgi:uncharacterized protein (DUF362 family)